MKMKTKKSIILINKKPCLLKQRGNSYEDLEDSISLMNVYLWIHGVGFTEIFSWKKKSLLNWTFSIFLLFLFDGLTLYGVANNFKNGLERKDIFFSLLVLSQLLIRFQMSFKRIKMQSIYQLIVDLYARISRRKQLNLKIKLLTVLILYDSLMIGVIYIIYKIFYPRIPLYQKIYDLPFMWGSVSSAMSIYFCILCYILTELLKEFKNLCTERPYDIKYHFHAFTEITTLIEMVNSSFHNLILTLLVSSWWWLFHELYRLVFTYNLFDVEVTFRLLESFLNAMRFGSVCFFASSMKNTASKIKEVVYELQIKATDWESQRLAWKLRDTDISFKFFNSIPIDANLVISSMQSFMTYGILIATFNLTCK